MAQGCGEHMRGKVCIGHCDQCQEHGLKTHIFVPVPDFFRENPATAEDYEPRCPVCKRKVAAQVPQKAQKVHANPKESSEAVPPSFVCQ